MKVREIVGYEGIYSIAENGIVYSDRTGQKLKCSNKDGYRKVNLSKEGKVTTYRVHRLVALAFIPNPMEYPEVDHIDENKLNNAIGNLRWCTGQMNKDYYNTPRCSNSGKVPTRTMEEYIGEVGKSVSVNGTMFKSAGSAAKYISECTGKNKGTISKEIRRYLQGKRPSWYMYDKYLIK